MKLFVVAAGGSGAKTAEALIHLCAAGLGPKTLHLLSVDTDNTNGNLTRLESTFNAYRGCRAFPWGGGSSDNPEGTHPFKTDIRFHRLIARPEVFQWGLKGHDVCPPDYKDVLDLFFTEGEQTNKCEKGFFAKPNLGSLVMGKHVTDQFTDGKNDSEFLNALREELNDGAGDVDRPRLVIVGSVFGGTGASVLPVATDSILQALLFGRNVGAQDAIKASWKRVTKSAVMLMPYFQPAEPENDGQETVDPTRFLADTKNALSYYSQSEAYAQYDTVYLIGSSNPGRQRLKFCAGASNQRNAPSIEELCGALACIEQGTGGGAIRVFNPPPDADSLKLRDFPWPFGNSGAEEFSLFLHAASFMVRTKDAPMDRGILQFIEKTGKSEELSLWPWVANLLTDKHGNLANFDARHGREELATYFLRLLHWAKHVAGSHPDLDILRWKAGSDALPYWQALCVPEPGPSIPDVTENRVPLGVVMATGCVEGIRKLGVTAKWKGSKLLSFPPGKSGDGNWLATGSGAETCILPLQDGDLISAEKAFGLSLSAEYEINSRN